MLSKTEAQNQKEKAELRETKIRLQQSFDRATQLAQELEAERPLLVKEAKEANRLAKEVNEMRLELMRLGRDKPVEEVRRSKHPLIHCPDSYDFRSDLRSRQRRKYSITKSHNFRILMANSILSKKALPHLKRPPKKSRRKSKPCDPPSSRPKPSYKLTLPQVEQKGERRQRLCRGCATGKDFYQESKRRPGLNETELQVHFCRRDVQGPLWVGIDRDAV